MKVIAMKKGSFEIQQFEGVSNIAYATGNVTITHGGGTSVLAYDNYIIQIMP